MDETYISYGRVGRSENGTGHSAPKINPAPPQLSVFIEGVGEPSEYLVEYYEATWTDRSRPPPVLAVAYLLVGYRGSEPSEWLVRDRIVRWADETFSTWDQSSLATEMAFHLRKAQGNLELLRDPVYRYDCGDVLLERLLDSLAIIAGLVELNEVTGRHMYLHWKLYDEVQEALRRFEPLDGLKPSDRPYNVELAERLTRHDLTSASAFIKALARLV